MADQSNDIDIFLEKDEQTGVYDIWFDETGQLKTVKNFDTALQMVVFCDARADESEVIAPENRRGWYGNLLLNSAGYDIGSKLWLLQQARRTQETLNKAINYVREACQWLIDDGHLRQVNVSGEFFGRSGIRLHIELVAYNNKSTKYSYVLWDETARPRISYTTAEQDIYWLTEDGDVMVDEGGDLIYF